MELWADGARREERMGGLVGEVDGEAETQLAGVNGIVRHGEIVFREESLVDVAPDDEESRFLYFCVHIYVGVWKVTHINVVVALCVELHCGRLVGESFISCVVVAVYSDLHPQHFEGLEINIHVGV